MFKKYKKQLIFSSIVILLPIVCGLLMWDRLPELLPTHWNTTGEVDQYSPRWLAVFGLPLFLVAIQWLCLLVTESDKHNEGQTKKVMSLTFWICPVISIFGSAAIYATALGHPMNMSQAPCILVGIIFIIIGNYLPKCKHNYTIGIKLPWTLASEENWNATHRFGGKVWVFGGFMFLLLTFLPSDIMFMGLIVAMVFLVALPTIYSYRYQKKHG